MTLFESIILGAVEGLTEFIPVSSSGHLILAREALNFPLAHTLAYDAVLQFAAALAIIVYFRRELAALCKGLYGKAPGERRLLAALAAGTIPAAVMGFLAEGYLESSLRSASFVAWMLIAGSVLLFVAERAATGRRELTPAAGLIVGLFQTLALLPGMSRSGASIAGGLIAGLPREAAVRFSFLLGLPILLGAGAKKFLDLAALDGASAFTPALFAGSAVSFLVGLAAIHFLVRYLRTHTLTVFIVYRVALALVILVILAKG